MVHGWRTLKIWSRLLKTTCRRSSNQDIRKIWIMLSWILHGWWRRIWRQAWTVSLLLQKSKKPYSKCTPQKLQVPTVFTPFSTSTFGQLWNWKLLILCLNGGVVWSLWKASIRLASPLCQSVKHQNQWLSFDPSVAAMWYTISFRKLWRTSRNRS